MLLQWNYWYYKNVVSKKDCDKIIKLGKKQKNLNKGTVNSNRSLSLKIRDCETSFFSDPWVYDILWPYVHGANKAAGWNFDIDWAQPMQFTSYKKSEYYVWHQDIVAPEQGKNYRKLSLSLNLNDSSEYTGGQFEFDFRDSLNGKKHIYRCNELKERGSLIVFPSFFYHRVKPVLKGNRYSLVVWFTGPPFK